MESLVTPDWLEEHLGDADLRVVDASWYMDKTRQPYEEYLHARIPGAVYFDIDAIADTSTGLPHMLPSPDVFAKAVGAMGIRRTDRIVVYDGAGLFSAPRVWWTFRVFGAERVAVLAGGLPAWRAETNAHVRPLDTSSPPTPPAAAVFEPSFQPSLVWSLDQILHNIQHPTAQVVDARSLNRFKAIDPEPRPGLRGGHIPGAKCVPFSSLAESLGHTDKLRAAFEAAGVDLHKPLVTSCGSGVTASILAFGLYQLGVTHVPIYDGSWSEYGARDDLPIATDA